jgi:cytidylate kinase
MAKKHIITIAGRPGSGKSSTSKQVATRLGYQHFSSGDLFRTIGKELGIDVLQTNQAAERQVEIDYKVDQKLRDIGQQEDHLVIDSRTAWHWIPDSFKVFLDLDLSVAAKRVLQDLDSRKNANEQIASDPAQYAQTLRQRLQSETKRYQSLYKINPYDLNNYDLVIDTNTNNLDQVVDMVVGTYETWLSN